MSEKQETIADIVAEMRKIYPEAPKCEPNVSGQFVHNEMIWLADRLEAARKREVGNGAKMREALELCVKQMSDAICDKDFGDDIVYLVGCMKTCIDYMKAALAEPPRNCDVGTAEEQVERFKEYCQSNMQYYCDMFGTHEGAGGWDCKEDCPIGKMLDKNDSFCDHCELLWAQMPYEEGGAK